MALQGEALETYEQVHADILAANVQRDYARTHQLAHRAIAIAMEANDYVKIAQACGPDAAAYWRSYDYGAARDRLDLAREVVLGGPVDEQAAVSTLRGRMAAHRVVRHYPVSEQALALRVQAVPNFRHAAVLLADHPHYYYRYANGAHGSVVAALATARYTAQRLMGDALRVAHQPSPPYDEQTPAQINPRGLLQLRMARLLLPLGNHTPGLAPLAREGMVG